MDRVFSLQLWRSRLTGGLLYHGALAGGWKSRRGLSARSSGVLAKIMKGYPFTMMIMMAMMACAMIVTPVTGFMAYDCSNASNVVEAYSLLKPAPCHASGFEHRYERIISAEIIQQKRERTVSVFRCHVVESVFSQYCGHSSAAGVTRYLKFHKKATCPQGLTQLFRGKIRVFSNDSLSFNGAVALLEEKGQVGIKLDWNCSHRTYFVTTPPTQRICGTSWWWCILTTLHRLQPNPLTRNR
jgi:hypothetical protein